jgi:hypothetical protein
MREGLRDFAGEALLALVLTLGFSRESFGLWPLYTVLDFPAQLGRAAAFILSEGRGPALVLGPARDVRLAATPFVEMLAGALGLAFNLGAGALCLFASSRERVRQPLLLGSAGLLLLGAIWPPYEVLRTPSPLIAGIALGVLALPAFGVQSRLVLAFLAAAFFLTPLSEMREPLFVSGAPGTDLALLERGSGVSPTVWCIVFLVLAGGVCVSLLGGARKREISERPDSLGAKEVPR